MEERIAHQRAIEEVYWRRRIWPKENLNPKPPLDQVVPRAVLRAKVGDYLQKSRALAVDRQRPITGENLQAEIKRMARQTKQLDGNQHSQCTERAMELHGGLDRR
jgi:hypothetical protein